MLCVFVWCVCELTGGGAGNNGQTQCVSCPAKNLSELPMGQSPHRPPLHSLQTISCSDLTAFCCRTASPDGHKTMGEKGRSWKQDRQKSVHRFRLDLMTVQQDFNHFNLKLVQLKAGRIPSTKHEPKNSRQAIIQLWTLLHLSFVSTKCFSCPPLHLSTLVTFFPV